MRTRRICSATFPKAGLEAASPAIKPGDRSKPTQGATDLRERFPEYAASGNLRRQLESMERGGRGVGAREERPRVGAGGRGTASRRPWGGLQVALGCARDGRRWPRGGPRRAPVAAGWAPLAAVAEAPGPETLAPAKVTQRPALTHSQDRPEARRGKCPLGPGRAASVSPAPSRAGRGRGRAERAAGRARLPVEGDGALLPFALPVGAVRGRAADHHLGPRAAARLRPSPSRAEPGPGPPRGGGARRHGCGTWESAPAAPYGKMAAPA